MAYSLYEFDKNFDLMYYKLMENIELDIESLKVAKESLQKARNLINIIPDFIIEVEVLLNKWDSL